jgi:hypothetical protein
MCRDDKYNTGFFALRASAWSFMFLEQVWAHNDFGLGQSDQASINHCLGLLSSWERSSHVKVYSRELLNAFPQVLTVGNKVGYLLFCSQYEEDNP